MVRRRVGKRLTRPALAAIGVLTAGCSGAKMPDPRAAADAYGRAAARGGRRGHLRAHDDQRSPGTLARTGSGARGGRAGRALGGGTDVRRQERPGSRLRPARLRFADGEEAALDLRSVGSVPRAHERGGAARGGGRTPGGETLDQLRRRAGAPQPCGSDAGSSRPSTRAAVEQDLRGLVSGLDPPRDPSGPP